MCDKEPTSSVTPLSPISDQVLIELTLVNASLLKTSHPAQGTPHGEYRAPALTSDAAGRVSLAKAPVAVTNGRRDGARVTLWPDRSRSSWPHSALVFGAPWAKRQEQDKGSSQRYLSLAAIASSNINLSDPVPRLLAPLGEDSITGPTTTIHLQSHISPGLMWPSIPARLREQPETL